MAGPGAELIGEEEAREVLDVIQSGFLFRYGPDDDPAFKAKVSKLEVEVARLTGVPYAVAVNSGTSALLVALLGLGVGPGDEVIVPGYTFIASMSAVVFSRAVPVLAEIDETLNLDPQDVRLRITPRTRAIMAVHMLGNPARLDELAAIAAEKGLFLIEDCAQAFGASYKGRPVGSIGDVGAFSFNVHKTITAGDGGMVVTRDEAAFERYFGIHDQGHRPLRHGVEIGRRPFLGLDFRMTELQAAVLLAQIRKLEFIRTRLHANKRLFKSLIQELPGLAFRTIMDEEGELATMLTVIFPSESIARAVAKTLETKVVADSGWHVYSNMENLLEQRTVNATGCPFNCPTFPTHVRYAKGSLPATDSILARAINIGIGISDPGIGAAFGVTVKDGAEEVRKQAVRFLDAARPHLT